MHLRQDAQFVCRVIMFFTKICLYVSPIAENGYVSAKNQETTKLCNELKCESTSNISVCGIRKEGPDFKFKLFANECELLKYGCAASEGAAYGLINKKYCRVSGESKKYLTNVNNTANSDDKTTKNGSSERKSFCNDKCDLLDMTQVCGIRQNGKGYRIKLFENRCDLSKHNCNNDLGYTETDMFICEGILNNYTTNIDNSIDLTGLKAGDNKYEVKKGIQGGLTRNIIVVDNAMLGPTSANDVNETIDNFFAATHVLDLPIKELDETTVGNRRMVMKNAGPIKVFQPWITIPKLIKDDFYHRPTLSSCYHKCPTRCPDTYAPVCGVPGMVAREPSIMFKNHCFMDVAQCKMFWENKSSTAISSSYIESSFLFCLGDQLNGMYRFLPLIRTLQHMGRLKKKGHYRYKLKNLRFFNNLALKEPKLMG